MSKVFASEITRNQELFSPEITRNQDFWRIIKFFSKKFKFNY